MTGWTREAAAPLRAPGLWAVALSYDNSARMVPVGGICLNKASGARVIIVGAQPDRADCSRYEARRTGAESWTVRSARALGSETITTDAQVIGELGGQYWVRGQSDTSGAAQPARNGRYTFTVEAKWLGACEKGQHGGDVITDSQVVDIFTAAPRNRG